MLFGLRALTQDASMPLTSVGIIEIPGSADRPFDHGTFDETQGAGLQVLSLAGSEHWSIDLPRRPRWCVTDAAGERVFLAIREPSMVLTARLPALDGVQHWPVPAGGAHGLDIDLQRNRLYVACDDGALVAVDALTGRALNQWPLRGAPDVTFVQPASRVVHVAICDPGVVQSTD